MNLSQFEWGGWTYYIEWNKSEKEKQISYINTHIWILEKWYCYTYLQGRNRDSDIENRFTDTAGKGEGRKNWESGFEIYINTLPYVK